MFSPNTVIYPKSRIAQVEVLSDGTLNGNCFSLARLTLHDGNIVLGIRWDLSTWSPNPDLGYPVTRGYPCWFVLPDAQDLRDELNGIELDSLFPKKE